MPLFPYECKKCEYEIERVTTVARRDKQRCLVCGGLMRRQLTKASFVINGYNADNRYSKNKA